MRYHRRMYPPGLLLLPETFHLAAGMLAMFKGLAHKYVKRVPTGKTTKTGKPRYRYYYHAAHGGTVAHGEHFVVGASLKDDKGHWHITGKDGDTLRLRHDETGDTKTMTRAELAAHLTELHRGAIQSARESAVKDLADARAAGASKKQVARLEERARRVGASVGPDREAVYKKIREIEEEIDPYGINTIRPARWTPMVIRDPKRYRELRGKIEALEETIGTRPWQRTKEQAKSVLKIPEHKHREIVAKALAEGKVVPQEVLASHPGVAEDAQRAAFAEHRKATGEFHPWDPAERTPPKAPSTGTGTRRAPTTQEAAEARAAIRAIAPKASVKIDANGDLLVQKTPGFKGAETTAVLNHLKDNGWVFGQKHSAESSEPRYRRTVDMGISLDAIRAQRADGAGPPKAASAASLRALAEELQAKADRMSDYRPHGNARTKAFLQRTDKALRQAVEAQKVYAQAKALRASADALESGQPPEPKPAVVKRQAPAEVKPKNSVKADQKRRGISTARAAAESALWARTHKDFKSFMDGVPTVYRRGSLVPLSDIPDDELGKGSAPTATLTKGTHTPPETVRAAARRGLALREKHGKGGLTTQEAGKQGIGSGVARARDLAGGKALSTATLKRMLAFFARHRKNKSGGEDDAGYIAWLLWGGDPGEAWARRELAALEKGDVDWDARLARINERRGGEPTVEPPREQRGGWPIVGFIDFQGFPVHLEHIRGSVRAGVSPEGKAWRTVMGHHYGEIGGTEGADGDALDAYVGRNAGSTLVVVVRQVDPKTGKYDEDKVMLGFDSVPEAVAAYKAQYDRPGFYGGHTALDISEFRGWISKHANKGDGPWTPPVDPLRPQTMLDALRLHL